MIKTLFRELKKCVFMLFALVFLAVCPGVAAAKFKLKIETNPKDASVGTVTPIGIMTYGAGTEVEVTAMPNVHDGYVFTGWSGASVSTNNTITVTMDKNQTLTANFFHPKMTAKGTFTDSRDGKRYRTVKIGKVWMAENMNFKAPGNSWCYKDDESNCKKYGRLYDWDAAMEVCPSGWRLPSRSEWDALVEATGGGFAARNLKDAKAWGPDVEATDDYGFAALPSGTRDGAGKFGNLGMYGYWWSGTQKYGSDKAFYRYMYYNYDKVFEHINKDFGFSVRCIKN